MPLAPVNVSRSQKAIVAHPSGENLTPVSGDRAHARYGLFDQPKTVAKAHAPSHALNAPAKAAAIRNGTPMPNE